MARFRPSRLFRRFSSKSDTSATHQYSPTADSPEQPSPPLDLYAVSPPPRPQVRKSNSLPRLGRRTQETSAEVPEAVQEQRESVLLQESEGRAEGGGPDALYRSESDTLTGDWRSQRAATDDGEEKQVEAQEGEVELKLEEGVQSAQQQPIVLVQHPTPDFVEGGGNADFIDATLADRRSEGGNTSSGGNSVQPVSQSKGAQRPSNTRRLSLVDSVNAKIVNTLLDAKQDSSLPTTASSNLPANAPIDYFTPAGIQDIVASMHRKIWVKRPGASATLVQIKEDDLVDDVRETILRKYANSLGKNFDAPDMTLHIATRPEPNQQRSERMLGPEEEMCRTIDSYYPGGQAVDEALIIYTPQKRTPKPSPRIYQQGSYHSMDEYRPLENGTDYFPPMPAVIPATMPQTTSSHDSRSSHHPHPVVAQPQELPRSISVLNTGQVPPLPSPGAQSRRHQHRPKYQRHPTSSPTILPHPTAGAVAVNPPVVNPQQHLVHRQSARPRLDSSASEAPRFANGVPAPPPLPTPPAPEAPPTNKEISQPPTPSSAVAPVGAHGHRSARPKKQRKPTPENHSRTRKKESSSASSPHPANSSIGLLDGSVPPINVLIVEDNIINLRILEGLMKRLKVRWQTAMNGQIAVDKWKMGGFHLVLMDIQMPVMTGLQATKEIRRLERVNGIGVFSSTSPEDEDGPQTAGENGENADGKTSPPKTGGSKAGDKLQGMSENLFKSPIIIVALTASSLQSDRHEALAAGCNDFLTKPVNFVWLERKVKEWGCMQALIDFDGWRKWKDYAEKAEANKTEEERAKEREKEERERVKMEKMAKLHEKQAKAKEEKKGGGSSSSNKRLSVNASETTASPGKEKEEVAAPNGTPLPLRPGGEVLQDSNFEMG